MAHELGRRNACFEVTDLQATMEGLAADGYGAVRGTCRHENIWRMERVVERFLAAMTTGDVQGLMDILAPDVILVADGGGVARAARHPVAGADRVMAYLAAVPRVVTEAEVSTLWINGAPEARIDSARFGTTVITLAVENGRITRIFAMRNPHKLGPAAHAGRTHALSPGQPVRFEPKASRPEPALTLPTVTR